MSFCSHCGNELPEGSRFCARCGSKITIDPAEETQNNEPRVENRTDIPAENNVTGKEITTAPPRAVSDPTASQQQMKTEMRKNGPSVRNILIISGIAVLALTIIAVAITVFTVANHIRNQNIPDVIREIEDNDFQYDDDWIDEITDNVFDEEESGDGDAFPLDADYIASFFAAELPDSWEGHCTIYENNDGNSVTFVNSENEEAGYGGTLVTIMRYDINDDISFLPDYQIIATDSDYEYLAVFPTDVQYDMIDTERSNIYSAMKEDIDDFLGDLTFF